jgi:predicted Fe-S protein YdhL (DUF1289 family)
MASALRATPCVGICSTTYGDLVCRGCKRFAHEIVGWNTYADEQRTRVWQRLSTLRDASTASFLEVVDAQALRAAAGDLRLLDTAGSSLLGLGYELLRRRARDLQSLAEVGLRAICEAHVTPLAARDAIDAEFLLRSQAHFEHSFHIPVDQ